MSAINKKHEDKSIKLTKKGEDLLEVAAKEAEKVDALEQYGLCQNLEIIGVPVTENEDSVEIVMEVAKALDVPISRSDISIAHRLPTKLSRNENQLPQPPAIMARFTCQSSQASSQLSFAVEEQHSPWLTAPPITLIIVYMSSWSGNKMSTRDGSNQDARLYPMHTNYWIV